MRTRFSQCSVGMRQWMLVLIVITLWSPQSSRAAAYLPGHALLVGCTQYEHLPEKDWLQGPLYDVNLMAELLTKELFQFDPAHVRKLAGWPEDVQQRPTKANIVRELQHLADVARKGEQVVILLAGHGSQQPADDDPNDPEPDGLDEIFVPADVKQWDKTTQRVENALIDDELRQWLTTIRNTGAFVWLIVDACHSSTLARDPSDTHIHDRYLPPETLTPPEVLQAAMSRAQARGQRGLESEKIIDLGPAAGDIVAFYAAQSTETTPEMRMPDAAKDPFRGLFTYTIASVLRQRITPLTYRELAERVTAQYRGNSVQHPTPQIEGGALDQEVLGMQTWPDRPNILLGEEALNAAGRYALHQGELHGLHVGDVLAVYPPAGAADADKVVGHVQIEELEPLTALVTPVAFETLPAPTNAQLRPGSRCQVASVNYGAVQIKLAVQNVTVAGGAPVITTYPLGKGPEPLEAVWQAFAADSKRAALATRVDTTNDANWLLRMVNSQIRLIEAVGQTPEFLIAEATLPAVKIANDLGEDLAKIARVANLLKITGAEAPGNIKIKVEVLRFKDKHDRNGEVLPYADAGLILKAGDIVAFRVTNHSSSDVDVTLLFIDSEYGITAYFPEPGINDDNRLPPGKDLVTPRAEITGDTFGTEHLAVIALKASGERVDFACLEQSTIDLARGDDRGTRALDSPLGQLLEAMLYNGAARSKMRKLEVDNYAVDLLSWRTAPATK